MVAHLKDKLDKLHTELASADSAVDMRRAQGKLHEIKQLCKDFGL